MFPNNLFISQQFIATFQAMGLGILSNLLGILLMFSKLSHRSRASNNNMGPILQPAKFCWSYD